MSEALAPVADGDDAGRVPVPGYVVDAPGDDVVFPLGVFGAYGIPDADGAGDVAGGDVETGGGEAGDGGGVRVAGVLEGVGGVVDGADEDGFAGLWRG